MSEFEDLSDVVGVGDAGAKRAREEEDKQLIEECARADFMWWGLTLIKGLSLDALAGLDNVFHVLEHSAELLETFVMVGRPHDLPLIGIPNFTVLGCGTTVGDEAFDRSLRRFAGCVQRAGGTAHVVTAVWPHLDTFPIEGTPGASRTPPEDRVVQFSLTAPWAGLFVATIPPGDAWLKENGIRVLIVDNLRGSEVFLAKMVPTVTSMEVTMLRHSRADVRLVAKDAYLTDPERVRLEFSELTAVAPQVRVRKVTSIRSTGSLAT